MKKLLFILLLSSSSYAQTTIHFYGSTKETTGAEILFDNAGFGFSGAWNVKEALPSNINDYDRKQTITSEIREEWCSLYLVGKVGEFHDVLIKGRGGLAVYQDKSTFNNTYTKRDRIVYRPLLGISLMYPITEDFGIEAGIDTFNMGTVGITILF